MNYYFILGRENKISQKELESVLAGFDFGFSPKYTSILSDHVLEIKLDIGTDQIKKLIDILGGTVKIFQKITAGDENIADLLRRENFSGKLIFGLSNYTNSKIDVFKIALQVKKSLKKSLRIIAGKDDDKLSSAQSFQYNMDGKNIEYGIFPGGVGKLIAVQNIDLWTEFDYGKPRSDAKSGMLPPKLARMMVNIAADQKSKFKNLDQSDKLDTRNCSDFVVVDPFCGSGNILLQALALGCDIIGSDISEKAVADTKANISWQTQNSKFKTQNCNLKFIISREDATKFDFSKINQDFIIVSEPYLGRPRNAKLRIEEEAEAKKEISKLYLDFLSNLKLTANSNNIKAICLVFPLFELANGKRISIFAEIVDFFFEIGYTSIYPPMEYGRDYQVVKREIVVLKVRS
ncbi:hypothetical protein COT12_00895 [Candidatus Berkelbacteria bacterium CG08_land_8_20_14_0_20_39_8]|uniref:Uncharacterized protein n=1 Tax=Candidatus Berkelbacteria bacterium CG08_land_8_20_14_0_20_39_8 TaxID=1974511 RepID=A0A2M6YCP1_9BACT|nr:MAG: hypothetical protein COT12_00895 [Candidatus Berkelbacteria bacterium CG08_land_8_20_14_0_20_39_8]